MFILFSAMSKTPFATGEVQSCPSDRKMYDLIFVNTDKEIMQWQPSTYSGTAFYNIKSPQKFRQKL